MGVHHLSGLGVGVADRLGRDGALEAAVGRPEQDARAAHRLQRVPGHDDLARRVGAELQMQAADRRRRHGIGVGVGVGVGVAAAARALGAVSNGAAAAPTPTAPAAARKPRRVRPPRKIDSSSVVIPEAWPTA